MTGHDVLTLESVVRFLAYFGVEINSFDDPDAFMSALRQLDPRYKDDRNLVRYQLEHDQTQWPTDAVEAIMACTRDMRMLEPETLPQSDREYYLIIVLGGARQSNLDRARFAARCKTECYYPKGNLVVAGSSRKLDDGERNNISNYAPIAETEFDLCCAAAAIVAKESAIVTSQYMVDNERAGTPDVLEEVINHSYDPVETVLAVTTQIYQLSTELDLRRIAQKLDINPNMTMAAGCPSDPEVVAKRTTATYLSEVLRTLRAAALAAQAGV